MAVDPLVHNLLVATCHIVEHYLHAGVVQAVFLMGHQALPVENNNHLQQAPLIISVAWRLSQPLFSDLAWTVFTPFSTYVPYYLENKPRGLFKSETRAARVRGWVRGWARFSEVSV
jgi:hypothetical protein